MSVVAFLGPMLPGDWIQFKSTSQSRSAKNVAFNFAKMTKIREIEKFNLAKAKVNPIKVPLPKI